MTTDDIVRMAEQSGIKMKLGDELITLAKLEKFAKLVQAQPKTQGFWWFWLRPEGGLLKPGFNLTICRGFSITLVTSKRRYRVRYRLGIKPRFLWSAE